MRHAIRLALCLALPCLALPCLVLFGVASVTASQAQTSKDKDTCNFNNVPDLNEDRYSLSPLEEKWLQVRDVRSKSQNLSKIQQKRVQAAQDEVFRLSTRVEQLARSVDDYQPQQEQIDRDREALGKLEKEREQLAANRKTSKDALDDLDYRIRLLKTAISTAEAIEAENARVTRELQTQREKLEKAHTNATHAETCLAYLNNQFSRAEEKISGLLIPESQKKEFKLYLSVAYAVIVLVVILGFFYIAHKDPMVRQTIFSRHAGIQFITLFSLVIAIILFGILEILKDKELAALLGGISGYILGHTTSTGTKTTEAKAPVTVSGNTIAFTAPNTIIDTSGGIGVFRVGDRIRVTGTQQNNKMFTVSAVAADKLTLLEQTVQNESAGGAATIRVVRDV